MGQSRPSSVIAGLKPQNPKIYRFSLTVNESSQSNILGGGACSARKVRQSALYVACQMDAVEPFYEEGRARREIC